MNKKAPQAGSALRKLEYSKLLGGVAALLEQARRGSARAVNVILTATYWEIGRRIVEYEQGGKDRASYGKALLQHLSHDLVERFGKGFGLSNLKQIRKFYLTYEARGKSQTVSSLSLGAPEAPKGQTSSGLLSELRDVGQVSSSLLHGLSAKFPLSWSHYVRLVALDDETKRDFYEEETQRAGWSVRELDRQINSMLYERLALSREKGKLLRQAEHSTVSATPEEAIKDPYVLEFLGLPELFSESDLENALIQHLTDFLLELGYGFTFVARQKRLQVGSESYYLDLLFYHRPLRCLVAIDLKLGKFTHADAGQMNLYLNYLRENETLADENPPVGLILCAEKDKAVAHYALGGLNNKVFTSRYQLQLPDPDLLKREIEAERSRLEGYRMLKGKGR